MSANTNHETPPSNPDNTYRSTLIPSMKAMTQGKIWTIKRSTRKGAFSTSILMNLVLKCFRARMVKCLSTEGGKGGS